MKILILEPKFFTSKANATSSLRFLQNQVDIFLKKQVEVCLLSEFKENKNFKITDPNFSIYELKGKFSTLSGKLTSEKTTITPFSGFFSPDILLKSISTIKNEIKPDVIYSCGSLFSSVFTSFIGKRTKIPTAHYFFHHFGNWKWWKEPKNTMKGYHVPIKYSLKVLSLDAIREIPRRKFIWKWGLRNIDYPILSFDYTKQKLNESGVDLSNFPVIYPGLNIPKENKEIKETPNSITYFGHLWQGRGVLDLVNAFNSVIKNHPDSKLIMGCSNIQELTKIHFDRLVDEHKLKEKIIMKGIVKDVYKELLFPTSTIVLPYRDIPSIKMIEALASGRPVITSDIGWANEIINDGKNGLLVEFGNIKQISEKINFLFENPKIAQKIGKNGRIVCKKKCDINDSSFKILKVLEDASISS